MPDAARVPQWAASAPFFWGACQAVIEQGLPFRVVGDDGWENVSTLVVPPGVIEGLDQRLAAFTGRVVALQRMRPGTSGRPLWTNYRARRASWLHWPLVRRVSYRAEVALRRWYYTHASVRAIAQRVRQADVGRGDSMALPPPEMCKELADTLRSDAIPYAEGEGALLFTIWREPGGTEQWHLVNYQDEPQRVTVYAPRFVSGWVYAPEEEASVKIFGNSLIVTLDRYKVLRLARAEESTKRPEGSPAT
jgi:hypothetical protein